MPTYQNKTYLKIMRPLPDYVERDIWDIPVIQPQRLDISAMNNGLWLINMKNISSKDRCPSRKIVHCFCYDKELDRIYKDPIKFISRAAPYYAVATPDFSMHPDMDDMQILYATYRNRWMGAYMQTYGLRVPPSVGWVDSRRNDIVFAGLRDGGTFIISTLGTNNILSHDDFIQGYREMRRRFPRTSLICVGDRIDGMDDDVCYVRYKDSFGSWDRHCDYWQPSLFNWDGTIPEGVW